MSAPLEQRFAYSTIRNARDTSPQRQECSSLEFVLRLAEPDVRGSLTLEDYRARKDDKPFHAAWKAQKDGPAWIPATFARGGRRIDSDVLAVYAVPLDFDDGVDRPVIEACLNGYRYCAHTSYSHHPQSPRWRVVIPLARPAPPEVFASVWQHFARLFDGKADPSGKNPSHLYYLPAVPPGGEQHYQQFSVDGEVFDPATLIPKSDTEAGPGPAAGDADSLVNRLSADLQRLLREGKPSGERSEAIFTVLLALFKIGADDATAFGVLWDSRFKLSEKCREQGERWLWGEMGRARRKAAEREYAPDLGPRGDDWPEPQPLPAGLPQVEPFELGLLPNVFRPWIEDIAERMQCPPDFPAVSAMVALAAVVGKRIGIRPKRRDDWLVIPNLWGGIIGRPGVMKTPALAEPMKPLYRLEIAAKKAYLATLLGFEASQLVSEERKKVASGKIRDALKKGGDAIGIARDAMENDQDEPIRRRYVVNDPTVEKLGELLNQNPNGLLLFRDELSGFLRTLDKEGCENARAFYLEAWNGDGRYTYDRIVRGTIEIENACVSILGGIQPGPLMDYMRTAPEDGLMQRFQLLIWPDIAAEWKDIDRWPNTDVKNAAHAVFDRLANLDEINAIRDDASPIPYLRFTADAQEGFSEWRCTLETRLREGGLPPVLESHLAKYRSLIPTLALLIHLADGGTGPVGILALERACAWGEYLKSHARRIYASAIAPDQIGARALAKRLLEGCLPNKFTLRDVYNHDWSDLKDRAAAYNAVSTLADLDWLSPKVEQTGGRPRTWYVINPRIKEMSP